jgi:hypothetical protein
VGWSEPKRFQGAWSWLPLRPTFERSRLAIRSSTGETVASASAWHREACRARVSLFPRRNSSSRGVATAFHVTRARRRSSPAAAARSSFRARERASPSSGVRRSPRTNWRSPIRGPTRASFRQRLRSSASAPAARSTGSVFRHSSPRVPESKGIRGYPPTCTQARGIRRAPAPRRRVARSVPTRRGVATARHPARAATRTRLRSLASAPPKERHATNRRVRRPLLVQRDHLKQRGEDARSRGQGRSATSSGALDLALELVEAPLVGGARLGVESRRRRRARPSSASARGRPSLAVTPRRTVGARRRPDRGSGAPGRARPEAGPDSAGPFHRDGE